MSRLIVLSSLTALLGGCGGSGDGLVAVSGTVKNADGTVPTGESALVWFEPAAQGRAASGSVQEDGSFSLMTHTPGDGVAPGNYKVVLKIWKNYRAQTPAVPKQYTDAATTPLEATVDADHTHFDFTVKK